jgi:hypothetical protein
MLNDGDQRLLAEIESTLRADDPKFARRFERPRRLTRRDLVALTAFAACVAVTVLALVNHNIAGTVVALVAVGGVFGSWLTYRVNRRPRPATAAGDTVASTDPV